MAEENDTLKLSSVNYTSDNYLAAKKNEDGSYNVEDKVVFEQDITTPGGEVATKADLDGKQDNLTPDATIKIDAACNISVNTATSVEDSNLPVTASAVNTKLGDYVNDIQAEDDSITVTKTGSKVTLKANGGSDDNELYAFRIYLNRQDPSEFNRTVEYLVNDIVRNLLDPWYGGKLFCTYTDPTSQPFNSSESFSFTNMTGVMGDTITVILEENGPIDKKEFVHMLKYQILVPSEDFVELLPKPVYSGL